MFQRWIQRLASYEKAVGRLEEGVINFNQQFPNISKMLKERKLFSDIEKLFKTGGIDDAVTIYELQVNIESLIQRFEFTCELSKNVLKDYISYLTDENIPKPSLLASKAFELHLIDDVEIWKDMFQSRNMTSHNYTESISYEASANILSMYFNSLRDLLKVMQSKEQAINETNDQFYKSIRVVFAKFPMIEEVILYGSREKQTYRHNSDADLCLKGSSIDLNMQIKVATALDELSLPYKIDLKNFKYLDSIPLMDQINSGKRIYTKTDQCY